MAPLFSCWAQAGINPIFSFEILQKILMEEDNAQREEPKEDEVGDGQHVGENSLGIYFILRGFH